MIPPMTPRLLFLLAALVAAGCRPPELRIERLDLQDFQAPAMFRETAMLIHRPFVLELPPRSIDGRFDLKMDDVTLSDALAAMAKLDPQFQQAQQGDVLLFWPKGEADLKTSPFSKYVSLKAEGGAGDVVRKLMAEAGITDTTNLVMESAGLRRPVVLDVENRTLRECLADVAHQAHLGFMIEPGSIEVIAVPE